MKKFKDTKFGKLLTNRFIKIGIKSIPILGGPLGNFLDDTTEREVTISGGLRRERTVSGSEPGGLTKDEWAALAGVVVTTGLLIYALITGDWETAEKGKDFIQK